MSGRLTNMKWWNSWGKSGETDEADIFFFAFVLLRSRFLSFFFYGEREGDGGEEDLYTLATFERTLNK